MMKEPAADNKIIYQLNLTNENLEVISPYLFVERLKEEILDKFPSVVIDIRYNPKDKHPTLIELKCFSIKFISDYQTNQLKEQIALIASTLRDELITRIKDAQGSVA